MTNISLLLQQDVHPERNSACMINGAEARVLFQLLRLADLSMSMASHLTLRVSGKTP